jgi:P-type E1-E2 ATPase
MISLDIPGSSTIHLKHLVLDVNGTLAVDGTLIHGIVEHISQLRQELNVHLLTADTHGKQDQIDHLLKLTAVRVQPGAEARQKADYIHNLGGKETVAIGQGANDSLMLKSAVLGICILSPEGTALETLLQADLVVPDIQSAFSCLHNPARLIGTLRK